MANDSSTSAPHNSFTSTGPAVLFDCANQSQNKTCRFTLCENNKRRGWNFLKHSINYNITSQGTCRVCVCVCCYRHYNIMMTVGKKTTVFVTRQDQPYCFCSTALTDTTVASWCRQHAQSHHLWSACSDISTQGPSPAKSRHDYPVIV